MRALVMRPSLLETLAGHKQACSHAGMSKENTITELMALAEQLAKAPSLLPKHARTPAEILAIILSGQELGIAPMAALRGLSLVQGKVTLGADAMLGLMIKAGVVATWLQDGSGGEAVLHLRRGESEHTQRFSVEDQKRAGLSTDVWRKFPAPMLRARCVSAAVRAFAPDVLSGGYLFGELPDDRYDESPAADVASLPERASAGSTPPAAAKALASAKAQGFVPKHAIAEDPFVAVDLQCLTSRGALTGWIRSGIERAGADADAKAVVWEAFCQRCADLETCSETGEILAPKEILAEARK